MICILIVTHLKKQTVTITFTNFKRITLPSSDIESDHIIITGHPGREWAINHRTGRCFTGHVRRTDGVWDSLYLHCSQLCSTLHMLQLGEW